MFLLTPARSVRLADQHEDDACRDVQAADWARDAHLHLEMGRLPTKRRAEEWWGELGGCDADNLFFYHLIYLFFCWLSLQCCKEHPVLVFRFLSLSYFVMMALQCEHSVVLYTSWPGFGEK